MATSFEEETKQEHVPVIVDVKQHEKSTREQLKSTRKRLFYHIDNYDPKKNLRNLIRFRGTVIKLVLMGSDFWALLLWHVAVSVLYFEVYNKSAATKTTVRAEFPYTDQGILAGAAGTLIIFALTFYVNQTYSRFSFLYAALMASFGSLDRNTMWIRAKMYDGAFKGAAEARKDLFRYMLSAQYISLAYLPAYKEENIHIWVWEHLELEGLLTVEEIAALKTAQDNSAYAYKELLTWTLCRCHREVKLGNIERTDLQDWEYNIVLKMRGTMGDIYDYATVPIPFAYYHLVNFAVLVYLFMMGYTLINFSPYWSIPAYTLVLLTMLGLRELAMSLAEPFGCDDSDLPAMGWMLTLEERLRTRITYAPPKCCTDLG